MFVSLFWCCKITQFLAIVIEKLLLIYQIWQGLNSILVYWHISFIFAFKKRRIERCKISLPFFHFSILTLKRNVHSHRLYACRNSLWLRIAKHKNKFHTSNYSNACLGVIVFAWTGSGCQWNSCATIWDFRFAGFSAGNGWHIGKCDFCLATLDYRSH